MFLNSPLRRQSYCSRWPVFSTHLSIWKRMSRSFRVKRCGRDGGSVHDDDDGGVVDGDSVVGCSGTH